MNEPTHYIEFAIDTPDTPAIAQAIMDDLFANLHSTNARVGNGLGFDVPGLDHSNATLGTVFRVFGTLINIEQYLKRDRIQSMLGREEILTGGAQPIPPAQAFVQVRRSRADKTHGAAAVARVMRRNKRRAEARGSPLTKAEEVAWSQELRNRQVFANRAGFNCISAENKNSYLVMVERINVRMNKPAIFNGYGFSQGDSTVPCF
ncbi:MAG: type I-F CRISPR-associated endoribonuclease Cas6/Csy4 [Hafnia sp.]